MAWLIDEAFPNLRHQAVTGAAYYIRAGINGRSFCLAVLAGAAITLLTRMHQGTDSDGAKLVAFIAIAFLLAGVRLFHSVLDSILTFTALDGGHATFGYLDWLGFLGWVLLGNFVGGLGISTFLRLIRSPDPYPRPSQRQRLLDAGTRRGPRSACRGRNGSRSVRRLCWSNYRRRASGACLSREHHGHAPWKATGVSLTDVLRSVEGCKVHPLEAILCPNPHCVGRRLRPRATFWTAEGQHEQRAGQPEGHR